MCGVVDVSICSFQHLLSVIFLLTFFAEVNQTDLFGVIFVIFRAADALVHRVCFALRHRWRAITSSWWPPPTMVAYPHVDLIEFIFNL